MGTSTITIDSEAYDRLKAVKRDNESLSEAIQTVSPAPVDLQRYRRRLRGKCLSDEATQAIDLQQTGRPHQRSSRER